MQSPAGWNDCHFLQLKNYIYPLTPIGALSNLMWQHLRMHAFSYAWSLPVTWQRWLSHHSIRKNPHATHKPDGSIFHTARVMGNRSLHCANRNLGCFWLLWPWPTRWPYRQTLPIMPVAIPNVPIWTCYVKAFKSYHLTDRHTHIYTDRQTESTKIKKHAASQMVNIHF